MNYKEYLQSIEDEKEYLMNLNVPKFLLKTYKILVVSGYTPKLARIKIENDFIHIWQVMKRWK